MIENTHTKDNGFLPIDYVQPAGNSDYMRFEKGENKFRILSRPIVGWEDWKDKKPLRFTMKDKPTAPIDPTKAIKHFWAMIVWNYATKKIQILEIAQKGVQSKIKNLAKDEEWGNPFGYDLKVIREGEGMETEYSVNPSPHKPVSEEILAAFIARPIYLPALYEGKDPFVINGEKTAINDLIL